MRRILLSYLVLLAASGCALIVDGKTQEVNIQTTSQGCAQCQISNDRGNYQSLCAPEKVKVQRDYDPLKVSCQAPGMSGETEVESHVKGWFWGNILIGGLIGMGIDAGTDAAWDYPETVTVQMKNTPGYTPAQTSAPAQNYAPQSYAPAPAPSPYRPQTTVTTQQNGSNSRYARPQVRQTYITPRYPQYPTGTTSGYR